MNKKEKDLIKNRLRQINERRKRGICDLCGGEPGTSKRYEGHHLTYEPEEVVSLCFKCHDLLHALAKMHFTSIIRALTWVQKFGGLWKPRKKYNKTLWEIVVAEDNIRIPKVKNQKKRTPHEAFSENELPVWLQDFGED